MLNCDDYFMNLVYGNDLIVRDKYGQKKRYINFDNAATTPPFESVVSAVDEYMKYYSSVERGVGYKSFFSSKIFEESRKVILEYLGCNKEDDYTVAYDLNTTHCLNIAAKMIIKAKEDVVICTRMEHHSNDLPWRMYGTVKYVDIDTNGKLNKEAFEELAYENKDRLKAITVTGASNVTGYINDIHYIAKIAHKYNAIIVVDAAQLIPHRNINIMGRDISENIDFISFSAHKIFAPYGIGVLVGKKNIMENCDPMIVGGGTVDIVGENNIFWEHAPKKHEGGTPNVVGVVALCAALNKMKEIGFETIEAREKMLQEYFNERIIQNKNIKIFYDINEKNRVPVCPFSVDNFVHRQVGDFLGNEKCIGVRTGCFCAQIYMKRLMGLKDSDTFIYAFDKTLKSPGLIRASFTFYNTLEEIDYFFDSLEEMIDLQ